VVIRGVGVDIVSIERIRRILGRWGSRFTKRVFTVLENEEAIGKKEQAAYYALRFAAKEAFAKAVGTGVRHPLVWRAIEVRSDSKGKPYLVLSKEAEVFCNELGICSWHLSLSDERDYAVALVVVSGKEEQCTS